MPLKKKHIDDVQPSTVDQHFRVLLNDEKTIDYEASEEITPEDLPEWYDEELFKAGQQYYSTNKFGLATAALTGVVAVFAIPSILKVLIYTNRSSTPCTAFIRYFETILHTDAWYTTDVKDKNSDWYRSTNTVRWKHCLANRRSSRDGFGGITHRDMALTQFGFIGYVLLHPELLGLTNTPKEREGLNHYWRVVGHMIGISDRLNICRKNEAETTELCGKLKDQVFGKYLKEIPPNFIEMSKAFLEGMWSVDTSIDSDAVLSFTYKLNDLPYHKPLRWYSWLNLKYREIVFHLCGLPYIGRVVRVYYNYLVHFAYQTTRYWPVVAWIRWGKAQSTINLYPKLK